MSRQLKGKMYDSASLVQAVQAVKSKSMGYLKASKMFKVPRSTIYDKVHEISAIDSRQGPNTVLTTEEEERLAHWLVEMSRIGYGRSKHELLETVKMIMKADGRKNPFKDDKPGKDWYYSYMKRHPEISLRSPRQLGKERAIIKPENVEKWFREFEEYVTGVSGDVDILRDPTRLYNADESGFSLCPKTGSVIGLRGAKSVYNLTASDKSQITVLAGMSATAHYLRPMIVFPGQRFSKNMLEGFEEAVMGRSENGWMDSELFVEWLKTVFIPDINARQVKRPVILLVDGHRTHMTLEASDACKDNEIILYCLLEHASHLMQPCDLQLFGVLKETWKTSLREWQIQHVGQYVTKYEFASIFKTAWVNATKVEVAVRGFRDAGLFPLDKGVVLKTDKLQTSKLFEYNRRKQEVNSQGKEKDNIEEKQAEKEPEISENLDEARTEPADEQQTAKHHESSEASKDSNVSPFRKFLKVPAPKQTNVRSVKRELLPKAVTGEGLRAILIERKRKREEEERAKEQRKRERLQKKEEKEKEKKEKAEQRLLKMKERKEKAAEKQKLKEIKKKIKQQKEKENKTKDSDDNDSDYSLHDESEDNISVDPNTCYKCEGTGDESGWIGCHRCFRFFHRRCTDVDFAEYTDEEVMAYPFECLYC